MSQKPPTTARQALKMALRDIGGWIASGLLYMGGACIVLGGFWLISVLLATYYPENTRVTAVTTCMMVPGLIVISEVLIRARNLLGDDMPRRQQQYMDAAILVILVVQIATTFALAWMIYHSSLISAGFMLPVMVVCTLLVAVSAFGRLRTGRAGW